MPIPATMSFSAFHKPFSTGEALPFLDTGSYRQLRTDVNIYNKRKLFSKSDIYQHKKEAHMQNSRLKKRHHIIPEVYLKQWRNLTQSKRIIVWYLEKKTLKGTGESPKNIFIKGHYFTEKELNGTRNHPVEDILSQQIENRINPLISILESSQPLTEEVRRDLWYFVSTIFTRTAWWRETLQNLIEPAFEKGKRQAADKVIQTSTEGKSRASRRQAQTKANRRKILMDIE
ncbi:DUF4238 domain-containing protein [Lyngbya aestuarii]|uniref:DUF4238 domain-containing protein n=1 Tax=Lyngbya aestuarii TaxID=118322 RepID=UPI00403D97F2